MKKLMLLAAGIAASISLAGCFSAPTAQQQAQFNSGLTAAGTFIANSCKVVQPTLSVVGTVTANPAVATAAVANGAFCTVDTAAVAATAGAPAATAAASASAPVAASTPLAGAPIQ